MNEFKPWDLRIINNPIEEIFGEVKPLTVNSNQLNYNCCLISSPSVLHSRPKYPKIVSFTEFLTKLYDKSLGYDALKAECQQVGYQLVFDSFDDLQRLRDDAICKEIFEFATPQTEEIKEQDLLSSYRVDFILATDFQRKLKNKIKIELKNKDLTLPVGMSFGEAKYKLNTINLLDYNIGLLYKDLYIRSEPDTQIILLVFDIEIDGKFGFSSFNQEICKDIPLKNTKIHYVCEYEIHRYMSQYNNTMSEKIIPVDEFPKNKPMLAKFTYLDGLPKSIVNGENEFGLILSEAINDTNRYIININMDEVF